jgi:hypothetical protein
VPSQYSYATANDAVNALGARLYDSTFQQWTQAELLTYVIEALRTWNALSGFWRSEMTFTLLTLQWWYDLHVQPGTIIPYTVEQSQILQQIENHLLEPPNTVYPLVWSGSAQFAFSDLLTALQRRQDDVLGTTGCTYTRSLVNAPIGGRIVLPDSTIDIRRVAWLPTPGFGFDNMILYQADMWAKRAFDPNYTTAPQAPPLNWMENAEPPPAFDVDRVPPVAGQYEVMTINGGPPWVNTSDSLLTIPDDWTWVMKWGAMMDLLSRESNAKDALRAEYCKRRYQEGLALLSGMPTALALRLNNLPMGLDAVVNGDDFNPTWQSALPTTPTSAYTVANWIAFGPAPSGPLTWADMNFAWGAAGTLTWANAGGGPYAATVSVVQNAPVPTSLGDFIQVGRDDFDSIIDYAQHLAMFKSGGSEFAASISLYQSFQKKAAEYNGKLKEMGFFSMDQLGLSQRQERRVPRYAEDTGPTVGV